MENTESFELISFEELVEMELDLEFNPFDTIGCGYIEDDFTNEIRKQYKEAEDYYKLMENVNLDD